MSADEFDTTIEADRGTTEPAMIVDVEGFEGPLDLLLALARQQKVDLAKISSLALADQYLIFVEAARQLRLELAADYLVMAAWLAYLKSRCCCREAAGEAERRGHGAGAGQRRLRRLEAIRELATRLMDRPQLNRDIFARGLRNRSPRSSGRNSPRRCTICSAPIPRSASAACCRACASSSAPSGRWPKRAPRSSA